MKISTRVEFGILALVDIAIYSEDGSTVPSADISQRQNISQKYLEQILSILKNSGLVRGQKGSRGGYILSRPSDKITLCDVLNALDNNILADTYEDDETESNELRNSVNSCVWDKLNCYMREFTTRMTLSEIIDEYKSGSESVGEYMYYI
ncbi:MAG: Rrf2 family transcriptional regulator [Ruminococcus sp.]|nr:Rrf2 family transcriptional regulator [Ruminococcus sp.]